LCAVVDVVAAPIGCGGRPVPVAAELELEPPPELEPPTELELDVLLLDELEVPPLELECEPWLVAELELDPPVSVVELDEQPCAMSNAVSVVPRLASVRMRTCFMMGEPPKSIQIRSRGGRLETRARTIP